MITGSETRKVEKISEEDRLAAGEAQAGQGVAGHACGTQSATTVTVADDERRC